MKVPSEILVHSKSRELELVYANDERQSFNFEFLRVLSPSAEVQGHGPDSAVLQVGKQNINLMSIEPVGHYALRLVFSDGHDTGVYSWDYFEKLAQQREQLWAEYLQKLEQADASRDPDDPRNKKFQKPVKSTSCGSGKCGCH